MYLLNKVKIQHESNTAYYEIAYFIRNYITSKTVIVCIGTDKCIGDCLGPMVGTMLLEKFIPLPVYGTIKSPIHALNLEKKITEIKAKHPDCNILGIDACLGESDSLGEIHCRDYSIHPGKGVGKILPEVGDFSVIGIVDSCDNAEIFTSRSIRLSLIMDMAKVIVDGIIYAYHLSRNR